MKIGLFSQCVTRVSIACLLVAAVPACQAGTVTPLDKHARKVEKHLSKFRSGTYLRFDFRDNTQSYGSLGALSDASFQFTDTDSNKLETRSYDDLAHVTKGAEYIGAGSESHHSRLLVPLLVGAVAAGTAAAIVAVVR